MGLRARDEDSIPLCERHHRTGGYGVAFHAGQKEWERIHGTQAEHLAKTLALLDSDGVTEAL